MYDDIFNYIINKKPENQFITGNISSLSPLQVKLYHDDTAIECKATTGLYGLKVGSNVVLMKFGNQFLITNVIGTQVNTYMDSIMINRSSTQTVTTANATKVQFDNQKVIVGSRLSFDSGNYGVKIGAGVKTVEVDSSLWVERKDGSYSRTYIYKNGDYYSDSIMSQLTGLQRWVTMINKAIINVVENDLIYAYVLFSSSDATLNTVNGGYPGSCNLTVKAIELG